MVDFKPSQITLNDIPFIGTFDRYECELTAAIIVKALAIRGDEWRSIEARLCRMAQRRNSNRVYPSGHREDGEICDSPE